ncbi:hypothetical protein OJF2_02170 [Aquisphaera giovannonii]|uniref:Orc1-like AAA ATPase domain-containing protein n=1 Tax=Aquisphaera giovannonii TaxID=406548 RepID=A0A5B9VTW7_9BACT|nr:ATP-binding protein [Aquisphaera giovannonii]QEH31752.1 hypothetical protein OJF2_02170 [Aquisphaera giovannonii]
MSNKTISLASISSQLSDFVDRVRAAVGQKRRPLPDTGTRRRDLLAAAALLDEFDPNALSEALGPAASDERLADAEALIATCVPVAQSGGVRMRRMRTTPRRRVVAQLVADGVAADAVRRAEDELGLPVNPVLAGYLRGTSLPAADLPASQLAAALQAYEVLRDLPGVPDTRAEAAEAEARLDRESLLQTLRALAGGRFSGRARELADLIAFAGLPRRSAGELDAEVRPLLVHGPGGMGKSTLLAELLLREAVLGIPPRCPFAYLDFDRRSLSIEYPATLLYEALSQLAAFYPNAREPLREIRARWQEEFRRDRDEPMQSSLESAAFSQGRQTGRFTFEFSQALAGLAPSDRPFLLVLDTFEEVQGRSGDYVAELSGFLADLQSQLATSGGPRLRVIISGRIPVPELGVRPYPLGPLAPEAAEQFLIDLGVDRALAPRVVKQVRGVPLTLRVAAELVTQARDEVLAEGEFDGLHPIWYALQDAQIQGLLIERYLGQVVDEDVRRLAYPGLVLRRITPDVIREVLAGPCRLKFVATAAEEQGSRGRHTPETLFRALSREVSLVFRERDGVLKNLPDVRVVLLDMLAHGGWAAKMARRIHRNAVTFYERFPDLESRAEEIYHRLQLGQSQKALQQRWLPGVERLLRESLDELPPASQRILADRLELTGELEADPRRRAALDQAGWERYAARRAERQIKLNQPAEARTTLREREERLSGSKLFALEVTVLKHLQDWAGMREVAARGLAAAADAGDPKMAYELGRQLIQAILLSRDLTGAPRAIAGARGLSIKGDPVRQLAFELELDLAEIRVAQAAVAPAREPVAFAGALGTTEVSAAIEERAAWRLRELMAGPRAWGFAGLSRIAAGLLGTRYPELIREVVRRYGVAEGPLNPPRRRLLCRALVTWDEISSANRRRPDGILADAAGRPTFDQTIESWWSQLVDRQGVVNDVINSLSARFGLPDNALRRFGELFRMPPETEMFAPLHTHLLDAMTPHDLTRFVADELGEDLSKIAKGTDQRDVVRQLLSWAHEQGRFQELLDRLTTRNKPVT